MQRVGVTTGKQPIMQLFRVDAAVDMQEIFHSCKSQNSMS